MSDIPPHIMSIANIGVIAGIIAISCAPMGEIYESLRYVGYIFFGIAMCFFIPALGWGVLNILKDLPTEIRKIITFEEEANENKI